jgi:hypothetical protein
LLPAIWPPAPPDCAAAQAVGLNLDNWVLVVLFLVVTTWIGEQPVAALAWAQLLPPPPPCACPSGWQLACFKLLLRADAGWLREQASAPLLVCDLLQA